MKNLLGTTVLAVLFVSFLAAPLHAKEEKISKTFKNISNLDIETVSGDCIVKAGTGNKVAVDLVYEYSQDCFEPEFIENGDRLRLKERFRGYGCSGYSTWTITVPKGVNIDFSSASGGIALTGCEGEFILESASGRIEIENCKGDFEIDNASGRIYISASNGRFEIDNASGRIAMRDVSGEFEIDNASGTIDVENARGGFEVDNASGDIDATEILIEDRSTFDTASGDVVLNYGGNKVIGFFEFSAREDRGRIISPYKFDKEEESERGNKIYVRKSFTRERAKPEIILSTSSGRAELRLK